MYSNQDYKKNTQRYCISNHTLTDKIISHKKNQLFFCSFPSTQRLINSFWMWYQSKPLKLTVGWFLVRDLVFTLFFYVNLVHQRHSLVGIRQFSPFAMILFVPSAFLGKQPWYIRSILSFCLNDECVEE